MMGFMAWDGDQYQRRFDALAAQGNDVHGEASFVMELSAGSVLDAGCGTGRVATELARRGVDVVGVDCDASMIATARRRAPGLDWRQLDLVSGDLHRAFDVVVLAGNVVLFTSPGTERALVANCARHVGPGGALVAGFQLDRHYGLDDYDAAAAQGGLVLTERFSAWDRSAYPGNGTYAVSVHRRTGA